MRKNRLKKLLSFAVVTMLLVQIIPTGMFALALDEQGGHITEVPLGYSVIDYAEIKSDPSSAVFNNLWVGDTIRFFATDFDGWDLYDCVINAQVISGSGVEIIDNYSEKSIEFNNTGNATIKIITKQNGSSTILDEKTYNFVVRQRPVGVQITSSKNVNIKIGDKQPIATINNRSYGKEYKLKNNDFFNNFWKLHGCGGGPIIRGDSRELAIDLQSIYFDQNQIVTAYTGNSEPYILELVEYDFNHWPDEGIIASETVAITIEDPIIQADIPNLVTVNDSINFITGLTNTSIENHKIQEFKDLLASQPDENTDYNVFLHMFNFEPEIVILEGSDLIESSNKDYSNTLSTSETIKFIKSGTLKIKVKYNFLRNFEAEHYDCFLNEKNYEKIITVNIVSIPVITIGNYITAPTNKDIIVTATTDGGTLNVTSHTFTQNGSFDFISTDEAGNITTKTVTITNIDKTVPIVTGVTNVASYKVNRTIIFNEGSATLNGIIFISGETVSTEGTYTLIVTDAVGNITIVAFKIDRTAPIITIEEYDGTTLTLQHLTVTASVNEGTLFEESHTFSENGSYQFIAIDGAGNIATKTVTISNIVKTLPIISGVVNGGIYDVAKIGFNEGTATLNGTFCSNGAIIRTSGSYQLIVTNIYGNSSSLRFTINNTPYNYNNGKLTGVAPKTKLLNLKSNINTIQGETTKIFNKNNIEIIDTNTIIGTGMYLKIFDGNTVISTKEIIIYGDVTGDGDIGLNDLVLIRDDLLEVKQLTGDFKSAGDLYGEGRVTLNDLVGMMAAVSENSIISQTVPLENTLQIYFKGSSLGDPSSVVFSQAGGNHNLLATYKNNSNETLHTVFIVNIIKNGEILSTYSINKDFSPLEEFTFTKAIYIPSTDDGSIVEADFLLVDSLSSMKTKHDTVRNCLIVNRRTVKITANEAETFPLSPINDYSVPICYPLPKDTVDYIVGSEISFNDGTKDYKYYNLASGKRVYSKDIQFVDVEAPNDNGIEQFTATTDGRYTYLTFDMQQNVPFDFSLSPISFNSPYIMESFNPTNVVISFNYSNEFCSIPDLAGIPFFKSATFEAVQGSYCENVKLTLELAKAGAFFGYDSYYNTDGKLVFRFNNPAPIQQTGSKYGYSLVGARIALDPGHSYLDPGVVNNLFNISEYSLNVRLAAKIKAELEALGASVFVVPVDTTNPTLSQRLAGIKDFNPHLLISIHHNSASSTAASGPESYYFNPFSADLSKSIFDRVYTYYRSSIGSISARGSKFNYFALTRNNSFPSTLVEFGFMSNLTEVDKLRNDAIQQGLAEATVKGIIDFFI